MNTKYYMMAALFVLALSCSKEMDVVESVSQPTISSELVPITFTVDAQSAKTALGASNGVVWSDGDQVSVFDDVIGNTGSYEVKEGRVAASVSETATSVFALYPSSTEASLSGSVITAEIPAVQNAVAGSFGPGANLAVARTTPADAHFVFRNVGGLLKFTLQEEGVTKVIVKANGGEKIAGAVSVTLNADGTIASASCTGSSTVTLQPESGTLTNGATYYIVVAPGTLSGGVTVLLERENQKNPLCRKGSSQLDIPSSVIKSLGTVKEALYDDLYTAYQEMDATLYIAGEAYSKAIKGSAVLLNSDQAPNLYDGDSKISGKSGVYFLDGTAAYTSSNSIIINKELILFGRHSSIASVIKLGRYAVLRGGGSFILHGIRFEDADVSTYSFANTGANANFSKFHFDQCELVLSKKSFFNASVLSYGIESFRIMDSSIQFTNTEMKVLSLGATTCMEAYKDVAFINNVVYSSSSDSKPFQLSHYSEGTAQSATEGPGTLRLENNIFYNITSANGIVRLYQVSSLEIGGNIYYCTSNSVASKSYYLFSPSQDKTVIHNHGDILYGLTGTAKWIYSGNGYGQPAGVTNQLTNEPSDPFEGSFNTATGAYTLKEAYKSYGPQK